MIGRDTPLSQAHGPNADPIIEDLRAKPVAVVRPLRQTAPFIFASPHSGRLYPPSLVRRSRLDPLALRKSEDAFVDELFESVTRLGAPLLCARFPRVFVDVNRGPGEIDPAMFDAPVLWPAGPRTPRVAAGLGVIPRVVRDGIEIYREPLPAAEAVFRLENFYRPYHAALAKLIAETRNSFGMAVVIDCHSMPPPPRGTDVVIGDCYGEAAAPELIAETQLTLAGLGFLVARNSPYAGGYTTNLCGRPDVGVHALQIEVCRSLYLDENRMEKAHGFASCQDRLRRFVESLLSGSWTTLVRRQAAAE